VNFVAFENLKNILGVAQVEFFGEGLIRLSLGPEKNNGALIWVLLNPRIGCDYGGFAVLLMSSFYPDSATLVVKLSLF